MKIVTLVCLGSSWALLACGGSNSNATVNGTINGQHFSVADIISANLSIAMQGAGTASAGFIVLSTSGGLCNLIAANKEPKNTQYLFLRVTDFNLVTLQTSAPTGPGTYTVFSGGSPPPKLATANYDRTDGSCHDVAMETAAAGSITLTSASNGKYSGNFDLTMDPTSPTGPADHVTGTFNSSLCQNLAVFVVQNRTTTCM